MVDKKELKSDPVRENILEGITYLQDNKKTVGQIATFILIILIGVGTYQNSVGSAEKESSALLGKAMNMYLDAQYDIAKIEFENIVSDHDGTAGANIAKYYLVVELLKEGEEEQALILLDELTSSIDDDVLLSSIYNEIGTIHLNKGDHNIALSNFKYAMNASDLGPFKDRSSLNIALTYNLMENYNESLSTVETLLDKEGLKYNIKNDAEQLLGELNYLMK